MKKKILAIILIIILFLVGFYFCFFSNSKENVLVDYNGNNLMISIDGDTSSTLPTTGTYFLTSYLCDNSYTDIIWDNDNYELIVSNGENDGGVYCDLTFKSKPLLNEMSVGSYVAYEGVSGTVGTTSVFCKKDGELSSATDIAETEASNSCLGQNARADLDVSGYTYGYCYSANHKYYTQGWRIAYVDSSDINGKKAILISAGSPECNNRTSDDGNTHYIKTANALALKYCNPDFVAGDSNGNKCICEGIDSDEDGVYDQCSSASVDAWAINDTDFYNITKAISGVGKRLTNSSSNLGDIGGALGNDLYCYSKYSYQECGYNNDLIDNGGYYWFASQYISTTTTGMHWHPSSRYVNSSIYTYAYGLRPVISLSASVYVTGGKGTMEEPYIIANN